MRARFNFSLMLALEFDIYLIDEGMPQTTDAEFNRKAGEILRERLETTTVIIVSHQAHDAGAVRQVRRGAARRAAPHVRHARRKRKSSMTTKTRVRKFRVRTGARR